MFAAAMAPDGWIAMIVVRRAGPGHRRAGRPRAAFHEARPPTQGQPPRSCSSASTRTSSSLSPLCSSSCVPLIGALVALLPRAARLPPAAQAAGASTKACASSRDRSSRARRRVSVWPDAWMLPSQTHQTLGDAKVVRVRVFVEGWVQGVWFRYNTVQEATRLGVDGWVRNLPDGRVEAVYEGRRDAVEELLAWTRRGPRWGQVTECRPSTMKNRKGSGASASIDAEAPLPAVPTEFLGILPARLPGRLSRAQLRRPLFQGDREVHSLAVAVERRPSPGRPAACRGWPAAGRSTRSCLCRRSARRCRRARCRLWLGRPA